MLLIDQDFIPFALALIESARRDIRISTFKAEIPAGTKGRRLQAFFSALQKKHAAGCAVKFFLNWNSRNFSVPSSNRRTITELRSSGIPVRALPEERCCHAKTIIIDSSKAVIGSHNLSTRSCFNNFEASYLIIDPPNIARLISVYDHLWSQSKNL